MNLKKLSPWNWFKHEEENKGAALPVDVARRIDYPIDRMQHEMDRMFGGFVRRLNFPSFNYPETEGISEILLKPKIDIAETDKEYSICLEIPGVEKEGVQLTIDSGTLTIKGEKHQEKEEKDKSFHRIERSYGVFQRVISLPADAVEDKVKAKFKQGVLTVTVPRNIANKPPTKQVEISEAD